MIELSSIQRNGNLYIVYDLAANPHPIDKVSVNMINSNQKRSIGLSKISFDEENGEKKNILFDVTGMMPLSEFLRRNQTQESFRQFILAIIRSIESFDDYMISVEQVILDPEYVYINIVADQVNFLCLPFADGAGSGIDLHDFFKLICNIAFLNVELHDGEVSYYNYVLTVLRSKTGFSLDNLRKVLLPPSEKDDNKNMQNPVPGQQQGGGMAVDQVGDQSMTVNPNPRTWRADQNNPNTVYGPPTAQQPPIGSQQLPQVGQGLGGLLQQNEKDSGESGGGFLRSLKKLFGKKDAENPPFGGIGEQVQNQGKLNTTAPQMQQPPFGMPQPPVNEELNHTIYVPANSAQNTQNTQQPFPGVQGVQQKMPQQMPFPDVQGVQQKMPQQMPFPDAQGVQQKMPQQMPFPDVQGVGKPKDAFPGAEIGGIAGQVEREKRAQNDLYTPKQDAPKQDGETGDKLNVFGGGMSGIKQEGLPQTPPAKPLTPAVSFGDEDDVKTQLIIEDDRPTKLMFQNQNPDPETTGIRKAWLISRRDGARIELDKPMHRVGRNRPDVDIDLRHNAHVGHHHAVLLRVDGEFVVIDDHSANHTYVNYKPAEPDVRVTLKDGDILVFADEAFEYHIEQ